MLYNNRRALIGAGKNGKLYDNFRPDNLVERNIGQEAFGSEKIAEGFVMCVNDLLHMNSRVLTNKETEY